jgi:hypothetical protein
LAKEAGYTIQNTGNGNEDMPYTDSIGNYPDTDP